MSVLVWRLTGTTGDGVNVTPSSLDLRIRCDEFPMTSSSVLGTLGIKVNLCTPRCICEGNVSRDWYWETCFRTGRCAAGFCFVYDMGWQQ